MPNVTFKMIYGSRQNLLQRTYQQGQVMLVKDSQQIIFNIDNIRRSFFGIIHLATQEDRTQISQPNTGIYLVQQTGQLYYYGNSQWKKLSSSGNFNIIYDDRQNLLQRTYQQGQVMLARDSQQIIFNVDDIRRSFFGIIHLATQEDRTQISQPNTGIYLVQQTGQLYYYGNSQWKKLSSSGNFNIIYDDRQNLLQRTYQQGQVMLARDSQQIIFNVDDIRRSFFGIIHLATQEDRTQISQPNTGIYLVQQTGQLYYYGNSQWKKLSSSGNSNGLYRLSEQQLYSMTQCEQNCLYLDQDNGIIYYGVNLNNSVLWIPINGSESSSSSQSNSTLQQLQDYINEQISPLGNSINGLIESVSSNTDSISTLDSVYSSLSSSVSSINNSIDQVLFSANSYTSSTISPLITQISSLQLLASNNSNSISTLNSGSNVEGSIDYKIKNTLSNYSGELSLKNSSNQNIINQNNNDITVGNSQSNIIINGQIQLNGNSANYPGGIVVLNQNGKIPQQLIDFSNSQYSESSDSYSTLRTLVFDPYSLKDSSNIVKFNMSTLGLQHATIVQLIDDTGLIRDDIIPVYWENNYLNINFNPIAQYIIQSGHDWKIKYLISGNYNNYYDQTYVDQQIASLKSQITQLTNMVNSLLANANSSNSSDSNSSLSYQTLQSNGFGLSGMSGSAQINSDLTLNGLNGTVNI